jgi:hypothetical protein
MVKAEAASEKALKSLILMLPSLLRQAPATSEVTIMQWSAQATTQLDQQKDQQLSHFEIIMGADGYQAAALAAAVAALTCELPLQALPGNYLGSVALFLVASNQLQLAQIKERLGETG